jgi:hypothetical protein
MYAANADPARQKFEIGVSKPCAASPADPAGEPKGLHPAFKPFIGPDSEIFSSPSQRT